MKNRDVGFWVLQGPGWLLLLYLIYAQAIPAINYDLGVAMGTQEPAEQITIWGAWGLWYLLNQHRNSARHQVSRGITENIDPDQD